VKQCADALTHCYSTCASVAHGRISLWYSLEGVKLYCITMIEWNSTCSPVVHGHMPLQRPINVPRVHDCSEGVQSLWYCFQPDKDLVLKCTVLQCYSSTLPVRPASMGTCPLGAPIDVPGSTTAVKGSGCMTKLRLLSSPMTKVVAMPTK